MLMPLLQIIYLDTLILVPQEDPETGSPGGRHYVSPQQADQYLAAVEAMLSTSTATWLVVAGHYTIYSVADHGNTASLIARLAPLLQRHGVVAYFNGHDHVLQHIERGGVAYFTSGHGTHINNFPLGAYNARLGSPEALEGYRFSANGPGFAAVKATRTSMTVEFIDKNGVVLYATVFSKPGAAEAVGKGAPEKETQPRLALTRATKIAIASFGLVMLIALFICYLNSVRKAINMILPLGMRFKRCTSCEGSKVCAMERGAALGMLSPALASVSLGTIFLGAGGCALLWFVYTQHY